MYVIIAGNLKTHIWTHTDERPFHCLEEECGKMFRSAESLRRHILSHRGNNYLLLCTQGVWPGGNKIFFMPNSAEHENYFAYKS